jgi:prepilin-type N-terminal cleavage/methylation domain-containing protein
MPSRSPIRDAFTLVELLVVVAVIGLLIGLLLPALSGARRAGQLVVSLSNVRQITGAALAYTYDNDDQWAVIPASQPEKGNTGPVSWCSWGWGGRTASDYWKTAAGGVYHLPAKRRPINRYAHPDIDCDVEETEATRVDLPVFRAPRDTESYQRQYWAAEPTATDIASYDDVGTSYHLNMRWWFDDTVAPGDNSFDKWIRLRRIFRRGASDVPSNFVWLHDQVMDVVAVRAFDIEGLYGGRNQSVAAYMDGHAKYVRVNPGQRTSTDYQLVVD